MLLNAPLCPHASGLLWLTAVQCWAGRVRWVSEAFPLKTAACCSRKRCQTVSRNLLWSSVKPREAADSEDDSLQAHQHKRPLLHCHIAISCIVLVKVLTSAGLKRKNMHVCKLRQSVCLPGFFFSVTFSAIWNLYQKRSMWQKQTLSY